MGIFEWKRDKVNYKKVIEKEDEIVKRWGREKWWGKEEKGGTR